MPEIVPTRLSRTVGLILAVVVAGCSPWAGAAEAAIFADGFDADLSAWVLTSPANWEIREGALVLHTEGKQTPPVRRPGAYALVRDMVWQDAALTVKIKSLRPSTLKGRDVCLIFGYQDATHFYYAHVCNDSNNATHNVLMKVEDTKRTVIMNEHKPEPRLTDGWHHIKLVHRSNGHMALFMDDLETPLMTATDTAYPQGLIGVGAFDDTAAFDDVRIETLHDSLP